MEDENKEEFDNTETSTEEEQPVSEEQSVNDLPEEKIEKKKYSKGEFERELTAFFEKHKRSKLRFVPRIVEQFQGQEEVVLEHLHNKYVRKTKAPTRNRTLDPGISVGDGTEVTSESEGPETTDDSSIADTAAPQKTKSKKKLVVAIIVLLLLAGAGAAGYMFKDEIMQQLPIGTEEAAGASAEKSGDTEE